MIMSISKGRYLTLVSVFLAGIALSVILFTVARGWERQRLEQQFYSLSSDRADAINKELEDILETLSSVSSLYLASQSVERDEFHKFVKGVVTFHPDILSVDWIPRVPGSKRLEFEDMAHKEGYPDFQITGLNNSGKLVKNFQHEEYFPIYYTEPFKENKILFGFDVASDPIRKKAMDEAQDKETFSATSRIKLIRNIPNDFGCRIFLPIYRNDMPHDTPENRKQNLTGFVSALFAIGNTIETSLKGLAPRAIDIYLYDENAAEGQRFLYFHPSRSRKHPLRLIDTEKMNRDDEFSWSTTLDATGKRWKLICRPSPEFFTSNKFWQSWVILIAGILLTCVLTVYLHEVWSRTKKIERLVNERTAALVQASEFLNIVVESLTHPFYIIDANTYVVTMANSAAHFGPLTHNTTCYELTHKNYRPCSDVAICPIEEVKRTKKPVTVEHIHRDKDGNARNVEIHSFPLFNKSGNVVQIIEYCLDITERKKTEAKVLQLSRAIEQSPAVVVITNTAGNIQYANPKFQKVTGYSQEEVIGKNPRILKSGTLSKSIYKQLWDTVSSGNEWSGEFQNKKKDGTPYWESALISPVKNSEGVITNFIKVAEDVTARKETEARLKNAKEELELKNLELQKLDKLKSEFVSTVSHELRTPLSITKEGISLILDEIPGKINEQQSRVLVTAKNNIDRLARIISDLLDISKIEAGKVELKKETINIVSLVRQVIQAFEPKIAEKKLSIKINAPKNVVNAYADSDRVVQIITNLVSNALKFTKEGRIEISVLDKDGDVECSVADTGIGIAKENIPKLFEKFQQFGRVAGPGEKGTGLGLSIAKALVGLHKGKIWIESEIDKGTTITFSIPKGKVS